MGKSSKPLRILLSPNCIKDDEDQAIIDKLQAQGHTIDIVVADPKPYDIVGGPECFRMFDLKYLKMAIEGARKVKYKKGVKDE